MQESRWICSQCVPASSFPTCHPTLGLQNQTVGGYPELSGKRARERRAFALLMCLRHKRFYLKPFSKRLREKICISPGAAAER